MSLQTALVREIGRYDNGKWAGLVACVWGQQWNGAMTPVGRQLPITYLLSGQGLGASHRIGV